MQHPNYPEIEIPEEEVWKDIKNFEGLYQISSFGRVKSLSREFEVKDPWGGVTTRKLKERILKIVDGWGGVGVALCKNSKYTPCSIHDLVLTHFICFRPEGLEGCHNDGNYKNNHVCNLRWDTHLGNCKDRTSHGTEIVNGICAKLTEQEVIELRERYATGKYLMGELSELYGLNVRTIEKAVKGTTWKNVGGPITVKSFGRGIKRRNDVSKRRSGQ